MECLRQVTVAAVAVALGGCAATERLTTNFHEAKRAVGLDPAAARPATQLSLIMQRRLENLPDAVHPDAKQPGLPGQLFLVGADGKPVAAVGDLVVTVTDETPRPPGQPPRTTEKWHFTPEVLPKLRVKDDRFGECCVLFLPWPADWKDVTRVTVKANYKDKAAGAIPLDALEVTINLDLGPKPVEDVWKKIEPYKVPPADPRPTAGQPIPISPPAPSPQLLPVPTLEPVAPQAPAGPAPSGPQTIIVPRS